MIGEYLNRRMSKFFLSSFDIHFSLLTRILESRNPYYQPTIFDIFNYFDKDDNQRKARYLI